MLYFQTMHNEALRINDKNEDTCLIRVHIFFANFLFESYCLDHLLFQQAFFVKTFSFSTPFYSWHVIIFFYIFHSTHKIFFWRKRIRHSFFLFFIQNKTPSYFEKETEWETIFLYFFSKIQNTFFCFDKSQIFLIMP